MARLEYIDYQTHRAVRCNGCVVWSADEAMPIFNDLPQIYWDSGIPWDEVNLWATEMALDRRVQPATICSLMEHLHKYASWLEETHIDWRHFPKRKADRVLDKYRGELVKSRDKGRLSPSTATARMNATIRFYRYAEGNGLIGETGQKWQTRTAVIHFHDTAGFIRSIARETTDLAIPNRTRAGTFVEEGLAPLSGEHMLALLKYTQKSASEELHLMLLTGFFTGARIGTITALTLPALEGAVRDAHVKGMWNVPVGPGTGIPTKLSVSGNLLIPNELMARLREYAYSKRHINRVIKARDVHKPLLFLTRQGLPFKPTAINREMVEVRRDAYRSGLKFMDRFKFHQARATFGTWLMSIALKEVSVQSAIEFVKRSMHHKHESTTFRYVRFIEHTKAKIEVANAFSHAFLGLPSIRK